MENGVRGYFEFISIPRYYNLIGVSSPKKYLELLKEDGYATSLDYVDNVYNVIVSNNLHRFDYNSGGKISSMKYNDSNKPLVCMQTNSTCYKGTRKMEVKGILFHSTGCNNPNIKRYVQPSDGVSDYNKMISIIGKNTSNNDWNHIERQAGLSAWIGKLEDGTVAAVQTMPWNYRPWGCGSGNRGSCNDGWIQFEICEDSLKNEDYFLAVYKEAIELCAYLCKMYGLNPKGLVNHNGVSVPVITCHADAHYLGLGSNHGDINHWFPKYGKSMQTVREDVAKLLSSGVSTSKPDTSNLYRVRKNWNDSKSQIGAYKVLDNAKKACKDGYSVFDSNGTLVYTNSTVQATPKKTVAQLAKEVIQGKWGNGQDRVNALTKAGYNYNEVQAMVSKVLNNKPATSNKKTVEQIAREVLQGKWGNGSERNKRLTDAGYNYSEVQSLVNKMVSNPSSPKTLKSISDVAREVLQGKWGNGSDRKKRLTDAGYNYSEVQSLVNKMLSK